MGESRIMWLMFRTPTLLLLSAIMLLGACSNTRSRTPTGATDSGGAADSGLSDAGVGDTATDSGIPDVGTPGDAGPPGMDAGPPGMDSGPPGMDAGPTPVTVESIQRGIVPEGAMVTINNLVVTGAFSGGLWAQDPSGGAYSGIRMFGSAVGIRVGRRVNVTGVVLEYFGDTEIDMAIITDRGAATALSATPVTVAQAASEAYEGVLVRLTDVSSTSSSHDCTLDNPACTDTNLWSARSSSGSFVVVSDYIYEGFDWAGSVGSRTITGVLSFRYDTRRIMPRTDADLP